MITAFEVDGVPALFTPATGPTRAGLAFRVGIADETLPRRGITHLLEHLALHSAGLADHHYNGATGVERTVFHTQGSEEEIVAFLNGVCSSLAEPPLDRLAVEKEILRTEASSRRFGVADPMPMWRHGARDYGVSSFPEWGLAGFGPDDLHAWAARYFTRANAVLWVAGPAVPAGLRLTLPDGERRPAPAPSSALPARPAFFSGSAGAVVWDATVRRETAAGVFAGVLERALMRSLRQEQGLSYTVRTDYDQRDDGSAVITAVADALPDKQGAVLGGLVDVLAAMRIGRLDPADVTTVINQRVTALEQAEEHGGRLPGQAFNLLAGRPVRQLEEAVAETRAVSHADVVRVAGAAYADGLLMTPEGSVAEWAGYAAAPTFSAGVVTGEAYPSLEHPDVRVIVGSDGVSLADDSGAATVRFDACAVMLCWPDGARRLIGNDAISVHLEPTLHRGLADVMPLLDACLAPELRVEMPARDPQRIPRPGKAPKPSRPRGARPWWRVTRSRARYLIWVVVAAFVAVLAQSRRDDGRSSTNPVVLFVVVVAILAVAGTIGGFRKRRR
jgi:zinc protease